MPRRAIKTSTIVLLCSMAASLAAFGQAATPAHISMRDCTGSPINRTVTILPLDGPTGFYGTNLGVGGPITVMPIGGAGDTNLIVGNYQLSFSGYPKSMQIFWPADPAITNVADPRLRADGLVKVFNYYYTNALGVGAAVAQAAHATNADMAATVGPGVVNLWRMDINSASNALSGWSAAASNYLYGLIQSSGGGGGSATNAIGNNNGVGTNTTLHGQTVADSIQATNFVGNFSGNGAGLTNVTQPIVPFTILQLPDQQFSTNFPSITDTTYAWLLSNAVPMNIKAVVLPGDITDIPVGEGQWNFITNQLWKLRNAGIAIIPSMGNHDYYFLPSSASANPVWNAHFGPMLSGMPGLAETYISNDYSALVVTQSISGVPIAYITTPALEDGTSVFPYGSEVTNMLKWATNVGVTKYKDYNVIFVDHSFIDPGSGLISTNGSSFYLHGDVDWSFFRTVPNCIQVMCGHFAAPYGWWHSEFVGNASNIVEALLFDTQWSEPSTPPYSGVQFVRTYRWDPANDSILAQTWYTPSNLQLYSNSACWTFPIRQFANGLTANTATINGSSFVSATNLSGNVAVGGVGFSWFNPVDGSPIGQVLTSGLTMQNQLNGQTIYASGTLESAGDIWSDSGVFRGNGSGLSNVVASSVSSAPTNNSLSLFTSNGVPYLTADPTGKVVAITGTLTATTLAGDGSGIVNSEKSLQKDSAGKQWNGSWVAATTTNKNHLTVMSFGDSYSEIGTSLSYPYVSALLGKYGFGGFGIFSGTTVPNNMYGATLAGGAASTGSADTNWWFPYYAVPVNGTITYGASSASHWNGVLNYNANKVGVWYLRGTNEGAFKVTVYDMYNSATDVGGAVATDGTNGCGYLGIAVSQKTKLKITSTNGTVHIFGAALTSDSGLNYIQMVSGGTALYSFMTLPQATRDTVLTNLPKPNLVIYNMKDLPGGGNYTDGQFSNSLANLDGYFATNYPAASVVYVGDWQSSNDVSTASNDTESEIIRQMCIARNRHFFDPRQYVPNYQWMTNLGYMTYASTPHLTSQGVAYLGKFFADEMRDDDVGLSPIYRWRDQLGGLHPYLGVNVDDSFINNNLIPGGGLFVRDTVRGMDNLGAASDGYVALGYPLGAQGDGGSWGAIMLARTGELQRTNSALEGNASETRVRGPGSAGTVKLYSGGNSNIVTVSPSGLTVNLGAISGNGSGLSNVVLSLSSAVNDPDVVWYPTGYLLITNNGVQYSMLVGTNFYATPPGVAAASFYSSSASINSFYVTNSSAGPGSNQIHLLALTWYGASGDKIVTTLTNNLGVAGTLLTNTSYGGGNFPVSYYYWTNSAMTYAAAIHNNSYIGEAGGLLLLTNTRTASPLSYFKTNNSALYTTILTNVVSANRSKLALAFSAQNIYGAASSSATWNVGETSLGYVVSTNRLAFVGASKAASASTTNSVTWTSGAFADNSLDTLIIYAP